MQHCRGTPPGHYYHFMDSLTRLQQQQDEQQQQQQTQKERSLPRQQLVHSSTNYTVTEQSSLPMQVQEDPFLQVGDGSNGIYFFMFLSHTQLTHSL